MAKTVRDFVKNSLNSYYKNFQVKMGANVDPSINNIQNAIRIANDGSIYIHDVGGFDGSNNKIQNASTLQVLLKQQGGGGGGTPNELIAGNALNIDANSIVQIGYIQRNDSAKLSDMTDITRFHAIDGSDLSKNTYQYKIVPEEKDIAQITKTIRIEHFANFELYGDLNGETILGIVKDAANGDGKIIAISLQNPSDLIPSKTDNPAFIPCYCKKYNLENNKNIIYVTSHIYNSSFNNCTFGSDNFNYAQNANIEGVRNYIDENATGSHAEGYKNTINGKYSHVEGYNTYANGDYSHAEGIHNKANNIAEHAEGQYNQSHKGKTIHSIGIGESEQTRKNAFEIMQDGSIYVYGLGNYDGSTLTNVSTLQDICNSKANKIINATEGHFASLDSNGNLQDSGKKPSDFANANHSHNIIRSGEYGEAQAQVGTQVVTGDGGRAYVGVSKWVNGVLQLKQAFIYYDNIDNLNRALATPSSRPENNATKLITSKAVYDALIEKADKNKIEDENAGHVEVENGEVDIDAPHGIHLHIVDESGESDVQHDVDIDASNVANLEDALASAKIPLWNNGVIPFNASNGSLVLVSDTSKYDSLFTNVPQLGAGKIYYSTRIIVNDTAVFLAICEAETVRGGYLDYELKKEVTMFVGGYTLVIQKGVTTGTVTLKAVSSLDAVLSASVESTSQAES